MYPTPPLFFVNAYSKGLSRAIGVNADSKGLAKSKSLVVDSKGLTYSADTGRSSLMSVEKAPGFTIGVAEWKRAQNFTGDSMDQKGLLVKLFL